MSLDLDAVAAAPHGASLAVTMAGVRDSFSPDAERGSRWSPSRLALDLELTSVAMTAELAAPLTRALVALATIAVGANEASAARWLLYRALALAVGDPHDVMLALEGADAVRPEQLSPPRAAAYEVIASSWASLRAFSEVNELATLIDIVGSIVGIGRDKASLDDELRARIVARNSTWSRAFALLWDDARDVDAASIARDRTAESLVRAAAALRAVADDLDRGLAPRTELLVVLVELVDGHDHEWGAPWAPDGLFAELGHPLGLALLSPSARVGVGKARPERAALLVRALVAALDVFPDARKQRATLAGNTLLFALGRLAPRWPRDAHTSVLIPPLEELEALEREVLEAVARSVSQFEWNFSVHHALFDLGLPASWLGLRRYLGIDPPGAMEMPVSVVLATGARTLPLGLAVQRMLTGDVAMAEIARAMVEGLSADALAHLVCAGFSMFDARLHCTGPELSEDDRYGLFVTLLVTAVEARGAAAMEPLLRERAERLLDRGWALSPTVALMLALSRFAAARGEAPSERFDPLIKEVTTGVERHPPSTREILSRLPEARRDAVLLEVARWGLEDGPGSHDYSDLLSERTRRETKGLRQ